MIEIKEHITYSVEYDGKIWEYDDYHKARKCQKRCLDLERVKYMDKLGIPKNGLCLVWTNKSYGVNNTNHYCVLMYNQMCIAEFSYNHKDKKALYGRATRWTDDHIGGTSLDDILNNRSEYERIWNSQNYTCRGTAFLVHWGDTSDWSNTFDFAMHPDHTKDGVNIEIL